MAAATDGSKSRRMQKFYPLTCLLAACIAISCGAHFSSPALAAQAPKAKTPASVPARTIDGVIPVGTDLLVLPNKEVICLLVTMEARGLEGSIADGEQALIGPDGKKIENFPAQVAFRITATSRSSLIGVAPLEWQTEDTAEQARSQLKFRLKVFEGVIATTLEPASAKMIGIPAERPSDERIYLAQFGLKNVPLSRRLMLEVLDKNGARVTKFPVFIY